MLQLSESELSLLPSLLPYASGPEFLRLKAMVARQSPAAMAMAMSGGKWVLPPHLALLNEKLRGVAEGRIKRLLVTMPPRHGKSELISRYFPAWFLGSFSDRRVILTSYEAEFAAEWGGKARDLLQEHGPHYFGVSVRSDSKATNRWNITGRDGGMNTAGVGGPITGKGAHLLIIDDPVKNSEEAHSDVIREKAWQWYLSTAYTRLEPGGAIILIQTRWHLDDLAGRILAQDTGEHWDVLTLPALATEGDPLGRQPGESLWPERYDVAKLQEIRETVGEYWFASLFQQNPIPEGGLLFKGVIEVVDARPAQASFVRYWDKAGTQGGGAYTAGVLMARDRDAMYYVCDVVRGQWGATEREQTIKQTAELDGRSVHVYVEREPGSGGKESAETTVKMLAGWVGQIDLVTGDKTERARPLAAQVGVGNVKIVRDTPAKRWNAAYLDEVRTFPSGTYKDQVDASSGAFNKLALADRPGASAVSGKVASLMAVPRAIKAPPMMGWR